MIETIGCLSYAPTGCGTPQIQYFLRALGRLYCTRVPIGVFAPRWESHPDCHEQFAEFAILHFWPIEEHRTANPSHFSNFSLAQEQGDSGSPLCIA